MPVSKFSLVSLLLLTSSASAGGLTLPTHGVRSLERGGALIAGADDADSLWLNPAGLGHLAGTKKQALLFDVAVLYQTVEYTRLDVNNGGAPFPQISNQQPGTLAPSLAGALGVGDKLVIAGGLSFPHQAFSRYAAGGVQRYAAVGLDGSRYVVVTAGVGYRVSDQLRVGAALSNFVTFTRLAIVASGCPQAMSCAPEEPGFDLGLSLEQTDAISPSGSVGVQYDATPALTLGLALDTPRTIAATGKLTLDLPGALPFEDATVSGDRASLEVTYPAAIRAGVEWRPIKALRIEAALDVELWSMHDEITLTPDGIVIDNVGGASFTLQPMTIPRDYKTTFAPALGVEWHGPKVMVGAGYSYETAAAPTKTVSVLAIDSAKHLIGIGGGYEDGGWQIGAAAGLVALAGVNVSLAGAGVPQLSPLGNPDVTNVNAGSYRSRYLMAGLRFARRW